jgi:oxalate decarboxylase
MAEVSRRGLLTTAAVGSLAAAGAARAQGQSQGQGASTDFGPESPGVFAASRSHFRPPKTDHGDVAAFRWPFSAAWTRQQEGGWTRQITIEDFPAAKTLAGVNMRLDAGGVRELHWHLPAEWSYMISGSARITAVDQEGRHFAADVKAGDLWYFPGGVPHSIQGLGPNGCEFLLVFDDPHFSEDSTLLITEWMNRTPRDILAKNFGVSEQVFADIPTKQKYIFPAPLPAPLSADLGHSKTPLVPEPFNFSLMAQKPVVSAGGRVYVADSHNFKAAKTIAAALVEIEPGGLRELHWHPNTDEWQYWISGDGRMTVFKGGDSAHTLEFHPGDVGVVEKSSGHYIENIGSTPLRYLEIFASDRYEDVSLTQWMANTPPELVKAHLGVSDAFLQSLPQAKHMIVDGRRA